MKHWINTLCVFAVLRASTQSEPDIWTVHADPTAPPQHITLKNWIITPGDWFKITDADTHTTYWVQRSELEKKNIKIDATYEKNADSRFSETVITQSDTAAPELKEKIQRLAQDQENFMHKIENDFKQFIYNSKLTSSKNLRYKFHRSIMKLIQK